MLFLWLRAVYNTHNQNPIRPGRIMLHRHLDHQRFTLAAIDDVVTRGKRKDWEELRKAVLADRSVLDKVARICRPHVSDPYAQRYIFWMNYVEKHQAAA